MAVVITMTSKITTNERNIRSYQDHIWKNIEMGDLRVEYSGQNQVVLVQVVLIQAHWRGYRIRKCMVRMDDCMTFVMLMECLMRYLENLRFTKHMNQRLSKRKIRNLNFPAEISENIAKFAIFRKYRIMPSWDTTKGDLVIDKPNLYKRIEVKGFMSDGPISFGPNESWDWLYFVDARQTREYRFKVYEVKLSNTHPDFRGISLSKKETFDDIARSGRRPRGCFDAIFRPQLVGKYKCIFDGYISELNTMF